MTDLSSDSLMQAAAEVARLTGAVALTHFRSALRVETKHDGSLGAAAVLTTDEKFTHRPERLDAWRRLTEQAGFVRSWGDCYGYLLVATGRAEAMVDGIVGDWDTACFLPILEEAGGAFTDW